MNIAIEILLFLKTIITSRKIAVKNINFQFHDIKGASPTTDGAPILIEISSKHITCDASGSAASASFPS